VPRRLPLGISAQDAHTLSDGAPSRNVEILTEVTRQGVRAVPELAGEPPGLFLRSQTTPPPLLGGMLEDAVEGRRLIRTRLPSIAVHTPPAMTEGGW
jgi:hypothetical protein